MQRFVGNFDFGTSPIFAYGPPKPAKPQPSPQPLSDRFRAADRRKAERDAERIAQRQRVSAMTPDERRAWLAEQRRKLAERKRLRELDPEQRREFIRRVGEQSGARLVYRRNDDGRVEPDEVIFGRVIETPPMRSTQPGATRHRIARAERTDCHGAGEAGGSYGDDPLLVERADGSESGKGLPYYLSTASSPCDPTDNDPGIDDELAKAIAWVVGFAVSEERHKREDDVAKLHKQIDRLEAKIETLTALHSERSLRRRRDAA
jgi:hypothetical protein